MHIKLGMSLSECKGANPSVLYALPLQGVLGCQGAKTFTHNSQFLKWILFCTVGVGNHIPVEPVAISKFEIKSRIPQKYEKYHSNSNVILVL